jgi:hypothetical protein
MCCCMCGTQCGLSRIFNYFIVAFVSIHKRGHCTDLKGHKFGLVMCMCCLGQNSLGVCNSACVFSEILIYDDDAQILHL